MKAMNCDGGLYIQKGRDVLSQLADLAHFIRRSVERSEKKRIITVRQLSSFFYCSLEVIAHCDVKALVMIIIRAVEEHIGVKRAEPAVRKLTDEQLLGASSSQ